MVSLEELRKENLGEKHKVFESKIILDDPRYRLESIYFWLLDFLRDDLKLNVSKISDEFGGSFGSVFYTDIVRRAQSILTTAREIGGLLNTIIKSIVDVSNSYRTLVFERLHKFEDLKSDNPEKSYTALKALKSLWLDNVDSRKGTYALRNLIKAGYSTVIDLFLLAEDGEKLNELISKGIANKSILNHPSYREISYYEKNKIVNERVISLVKTRLAEFYGWLEESEKYFKERAKYLKAYLLHQVNSLIYYLEIAKPYFKAARALTQKEYNIPDIVKGFESAIIEITLFATDKEKELTEWDKDKKDFIKKKYIPLFEVNIIARVRPTLQAISVERTAMYTYIGRIDIEYRAYVLTREEYDELVANKEIEDILYIQGMTETFLEGITDVICNVYLYEKVISNSKLLETAKKFLNKDKITSERDIVWTKELVKELEKVDKNFLKGLEWINKYLPSKEELEKKEEKKEEEKKKENTISLIFPIAKPAADIFKSLLYNIFEFIVTYGKDISNIRYSTSKKKLEKERGDFIDDVKKKAWLIFNTSKKSFGLVA
ncbi:hypothetical protein BA065_01195 [Nanoarchaeota archaeon NZ13-N]|nr:MAG: hypothetical protein BA065_01195 [Nanoarchaeota archaeon NZ13-N]